MRAYSPTSLAIFDKNCPHALELYFAAKAEQEQEFEVEGPEMAEIGIVFHACLHQAALAAKEGREVAPAIEATATALASRFEVARVAEGKALAGDFCQWWEFSKDADYEHGVAFTADWKQVAWSSPERKLRLIFDVIGKETIEHEYFGPLRTITIQDYKSGWGAGQHELNSIQMDCMLQAVLSLYGGDIDAVKLQIVGVRKRKIYTTLLVLDQDDEEIQRRLQRVAFHIKAADESDGRARYGYGCTRCRYTAQCEAFNTRVAQIRGNDLDLSAEPIELARDYAVLQTKMKNMDGRLKAIAKGKPIEIDGMVLAFHPDTERESRNAAEILPMWLKAGNVTVDESTANALRGLLAQLQPGVTALERAIGACAKAMGFKTKKAAKEELMPQFSKEVDIVKWGWRPKE